MKITQPINKNALITASLSFVVGTLLFLFYLIFQSGIMINLGVFYILIAAAFNAITFIGVATNSIINNQYHKENLITIALVVLNIPISIGYMAIIIRNPFSEYF